jgi:hypothetical protein
MVSRRTILGLLASASVVAQTGLAFAKQQHHHKNGHDLVRAKLKQNGKHEIDKVGNATVSAEVSNGKVVAMSATDPQKGPLPVHKVKSHKKMAGITPSTVQVAANGDAFQFAQDVGVYYAWCFDDGVDLWCYWYPADVVIVDAGWVEYAPPA